ncbi:TDT family transporter [Streptomyces sp. CB01881]|uniref:TDT family transporter n=1 Tax=Streptomyces sp. CB01881 TaxID=2078691 RepID=UPI000CDC28DD|nr:TDT family transporter [Streptomyces sp. CB01881]AUY50831.1 C4-dicarboxylate ABC transporter [Streptomyces sp. CB01881]TYC74213.1 C4-dicarboxylate ABC transporter [Streptomyces sp. CB01881]
MATVIDSPRPFLHVRPDLAQLSPNWYAAVMGTAIVGNGAAALPVMLPGLIGFGELMWGLGLAALVVLGTARVLHLTRHRAAARGHLLDTPATAVFYGCPPMALLSVGFGTLVLGSRVIGTGPAVALDAVLWSAGTLYALAVAAGIPYLMITRHAVSPLEANPTWLLPVVAPLVAASTGPALVPHLPAGTPQQAMLYGCWALLGVGLLATLAMLPVVLTGLVHSKIPALALTPSLFLVLGPLGQSTTAVHQLADAARPVTPQLAPAALAFAELYGVAVLGVAMLWLAVATAANLRARRAGMAFAMTWWAYTFPIGTCVTGAAALARHTGFAGFTGLAAGLFVLLVAAWAVAAAGTAAGLAGGRLLAR